MVLHLLFLGVLIVNGRWTARLRRIDAALSVAICGVMTWVMRRRAGLHRRSRPTTWSRA